MHSLTFSYDPRNGDGAEQGTENLDDGRGSRGVGRIDEPSEAMDQGGTDHRLLARDVFHTKRSGAAGRPPTS